MITETLQVYRGDNDKHGNANKSASHTIQGVFGWGTGASTARFQTSNERQESATLTTELYVPRGQDLKQRDRIKRADGTWYSVVGHAAWDESNPMTGTDFRFKAYEVRGTT